MALEEDPTQSERFVAEHAKKEAEKAAAVALKTDAFIIASGMIESMVTHSAGVKEDVSKRATANPEAEALAVQELTKAITLARLAQDINLARSPQDKHDGTHSSVQTEITEFQKRVNEDITVARLASQALKTGYGTVPGTKEDIALVGDALKAAKVAPASEAAPSSAGAPGGKTPEAGGHYLP